MRYRALDANGDMQFGNGASNFLVNSPAAVGQAVLTRLKLLTGEWFLDVTEGTPYATQILGKNTSATYDTAIRSRILGTQGVSGIASYSSSLNPTTRALSITATIDTIYGQATISAPFGTSSGPTPPPILPDPLAAMWASLGIPPTYDEGVIPMIWPIAADEGKAIAGMTIFFDEGLAAA